MSGSQDFIRFSSSTDSPRGNYGNSNWNNRRSFNKQPYFNNRGSNNFSPYNKRNGFNMNKKYQDSPKFVNANREFNPADYYHPSMLEDPWKDLQRNQEQSKDIKQDVSNSSILSNKSSDSD